MKLSDRTWTCINGHVLDRDINASKNTLKEGLKIFGTELSENTDRGLNETFEMKREPAKFEAARSLAVR